MTSPSTTAPEHYPASAAAEVYPWATAEGTTAFRDLPGEPPRGSVVMTDGLEGTAWQRLHGDGLWHSSTGRTEAWATLCDREGQYGRGGPLLVHLAPPRVPSKRASRR